MSFEVSWGVQEGKDDQLWEQEQYLGIPIFQVGKSLESMNVDVLKLSESIDDGTYTLQVKSNPNKEALEDTITTVVKSECRNVGEIKFSYEGDTLTAIIPIS